MTGSRRADGIFVGGGTGFNCVGCHTLDPAQGFFGTDGQASFENETQIVKIAHLRNMYQKVGMFGMPAVDFFNGGDNGLKGDQIRGFGFLHDGSVDTVFRFLQRHRVQRRRHRSIPSASRTTPSAATSSSSCSPSTPTWRRSSASRSR